MVINTTMDSMYLDNLDEFVNDEGRIITYKWLSLTLGVHTNVAKQMLYHFVTKQRNTDKDDGLNVTYMVSGVISGEDGQPDLHKMVLVREENLEVAKSKMKDVISVHIYSVQKTKLKAMSDLYTANYDKVKEKLHTINANSGIECLAAKVRSTADLARLQQQNAYQAPQEPAIVQKKAKPVENKVVLKKEPGVEENYAKQNSKNGGKPNQITSMFARQAAKSEELKDEKKNIKQEPKKPSSARSKKQGGISAFLNKAPVSKNQKSSPIKLESGKDSPATSESCTNVVSENEVASSPMTESLLSTPTKTESQDSTALESQSESVEMVSSPPNRGKAKTQSKLKSRKAPQRRGKSKRSDNDESPHPKRKRIMQMSDSESSSDEENNDEESPFPSSPAPEAVRIESDEEEIPATPQPEMRELSKNGRPKKRKLVSKTFMDDDGYIVTKKEYEYVSDSGEEEAVQSNQENIPAKKNLNEENITSKKNTSPKKSVDKSPKKSSKSPKKKSSKDISKTKQSSITSFFGKK